MTTRRTRTEVPYTAGQMFDLVADIERYPEFLPWCPALRIVGNNTDDGSGELLADMVVAYGAFREKFRSRVALDRQAKSIDVGYISGPFRSLTNFWSFEDNPAGGSIVHFEIDFELRSVLLQTVAHSFFEKVFSRMSEAFIRRAHEVYGPDP